MWFDLVVFPTYPENTTTFGGVSESVTSCSITLLCFIFLAAISAPFFGSTATREYRHELSPGPIYCHNQARITVTHGPTHAPQAATQVAFTTHRNSSTRWEVGGVQ